MTPDDHIFFSGTLGGRTSRNARGAPDRATGIVRRPTLLTARRSSRRPARKGGVEEVARAAEEIASASHNSPEMTWRGGRPDP